MVVWQTYLFDSVTGEARFAVATNGRWVNVVPVGADEAVAERLKTPLERKLADGVPVAQSPIGWVVNDLPFLMPRREIFATEVEARARADEVLHDLGHVDGLDVTTRLENLTIGVDRSVARAIGVASIGRELIAVVFEDHDEQLRVVDMGEPDRYLHKWIRSHEDRHLDTTPDRRWGPDYTLQQSVLDLTIGDNFRLPIESESVLEVVEGMVGLSQLLLVERETPNSPERSGPPPAAQGDLVGTIYRYTIIQKPHSLFEVSELEIAVMDETRYSDNQADLRFDRLRSIRWSIAGSFEDAEDLCAANFEQHHTWDQIRDNGGFIDLDPYWSQPTDGVWVCSTYKWE